MTQRYCGRFAPTPSGPLHFGSLIAAMGSYLEAKKHRGTWLLRIDDLDPPRVQPGATDLILHCLDRYGFHWDGSVVFQSRRWPAYHAALHRLRQLALVYPCACSRSDISRAASMGIEGPIYSGTCRQGMRENARARALRLSTRDALVAIHDDVQGLQQRQLERDLGDFVLYRSDEVFSFHLASAVDDAASGVTHIVRGADLLESSIRQTYIQQLLHLPVPRYAHLAVAIDACGEKLSKQTHAKALPLEQPQSTLVDALNFLGQSPPQALARATVQDVWTWAFAHWKLEKAPREAQRVSWGNSFANSARSSGNT